MGNREYDYIRGNTILAPERKVKEKNKQNRKVNQNKNKNELAVVKTVLSFSILIAVLCTITLIVNGYIYKQQQQLISINTEIDTATETQDSLNIKILQNTSIENVKTIAEDELGMVYPSASTTITIDMSKDYFPNVEDTTDEEESNSGLISKIKDIFSNLI